MKLGREAFVMFNGNRLSDHNRSEVEQSFERIESRVRTARGRMRKSFVADKRSFTIAWEELPEENSRTIDNYWGAQSLINFYRTTTGPFTLGVMNNNGSYTSYEVVFNEFSYSVVFRYDTHYYSISCALEEV